MKNSRKKAYKKAKKHLPTAIVMSVVIIISIYFAYLYKQDNQKIALLQQKISYLSLNLSNTASTIEASTSASIASAIQSIPKPVAPTKSQDELMRLAINKVSPSVASINILKATGLAELSSANSKTSQPSTEKIGNGTGIIVRSDGYIVTNNHVVSDEAANYSVTLSNGTDIQATVVYRDPSIDIAIIKIAGKNYTPAVLGNSDNLGVGETVEAIGNALGEYNNSVSVGIISGLHRVIKTSGSITGQSLTLNDAIQTDAAINPGNSGGPLVDIQGNVIGINMATVIGSSNISFAIPINTIKDIVAEVTK